MLIVAAMSGAGLTGWLVGPGIHRRLIQDRPGPGCGALVFSSPGCSTCRTQTRILDGLDADTRSRVRRIDVAADPRMAARYRILTVPTVVFVDGKGRATRISYGLVDAATFRRRIGVCRAAMARVSAVRGSDATPTSSPPST